MIDETTVPIVSDPDPDPDPDLDGARSAPGKSPLPGAFATTQWTRVLAARGTTSAARDALAELSEHYYAPVLAFVKSQVRDTDRARDLTHDFFVHLLKHNSIARVDPAKGRFRSFLLGAVKHFLADCRDRGRAKKRGAGREIIPLDTGVMESGSIASFAEDSDASNDAIYDRQWAVTVLDRALLVLEAEHRDAGRLHYFETLKCTLTGQGTARSHASLASDLGTNEGAIKVAVCRLRARFRDLVRAEISRTLDDQGDVQDELRYLIRVLGRQSRT